MSFIYFAKLVNVQSICTVLDYNNSYSNCYKELSGNIQFSLSF